MSDTDGRIDGNVVVRIAFWFGIGIVTLAVFRASGVRHLRDSVKKHYDSDQSGELRLEEAGPS